MAVSDAVLMAKAVRLFYLQGCPRVEVARRLEISRFKVARLLDLALESGMVTITINTDSLVDPELSEELARRLGIPQVLVVWTDSGESRYENLGRVAAQWLLESTTVNDVLGFDSGRTVQRIAPHLVGLPACDLVQLGGLAGPPGATGLDVVRQVSAPSGGAAHPIYAPLLAEDAQAASVIKSQPAVATTIAMLREVTKAVVSIGSWNPPVSQVYDRLDPEEREKLRRMGAVGETCALLLDSEGRPVKGLTERQIGVELDDLLAIPEVIAVGGGPEKANAILALAKSGILHTLVTDEGAARAILTDG